MPGPSKDDSSTPEDLLKEEIDDLEKPMLHAWLPWIIAIVGVFVVCIIVAMCFLITPSSVFRGPKTNSGLPVLTLAQPQGRIQGAPREFQWDGLAGAATYIVTITEDERHWHQFVLIVSDDAGHSAQSSLTVRIRCPYTYFFTPTPPYNEGDSCPEGPATFSRAAEQAFAQGRDLLLVFRKISSWRHLAISLKILLQ